MYYKEKCPCSYRIQCVYTVISASDDTISGSICDEADPQVVRRSRIPKPTAAKGSENFTKNNSR